MISISPENPTTATEIVFTFTGGSPCPVTSQSINGSEFVFEVKDEVGVPCVSALLPYKFDWDIGKLEVGQYQVTLIDQRAGTITEPFDVSFAAEVETPSIPTLQFGGAVLLGALLIALASFTLRRTAATAHDDRTR